jgi:hypothetical protein
MRLSDLVDRLIPYFVDRGRSWIPENDNELSLGSSTKRFKEIHAVDVVGTIGGATWSYGGDMTIDATDTVDTTLYIKNSGGGICHLDLQGDFHFQQTLKKMQFNNASDCILNVTNIGAGKAIIQRDGAAVLCDGDIIDGGSF